MVEDDTQRETGTQKEQQQTLNEKYIKLQIIHKSRQQKSGNEQGEGPTHQSSSINSDFSN